MGSILGSPNFGKLPYEAPKGSDGDGMRMSQRTPTVILNRAVSGFARLKLHAVNEGHDRDISDPAECTLT